MLKDKEIEDAFKFLGLKSKEDRKKILQKEPDKEKPEIKGRVVIADNVTKMIEEETSTNA